MRPLIKYLKRELFKMHWVSLAILFWEHKSSFSLMNNHVKSLDR